MKKKSTLRTALIIYGLLIFSFLLPSTGFSQDNERAFITPVTASRMSLNAEEQMKVNSIRENPFHKSVQFVQIGDLRTILQSNDGTLPLTIPGMSYSVTARVVDVAYNQVTDYKWSGQFIGADEGTVTILQNDNEVFGQIRINERIYEIQSLGENQNILVEYDTKALAKTSCGFHDTTQTAEIESPVKEKNASQSLVQSNVRVLFLYTNAAINAVASIPNTVSTAIVQMNDALQNSAVSANLRVSLAGMELLSFTEDPSDIAQDVSDLSVNTTAQNLRNSYQADLVILLTDGNYNNGTTYGRVRSIGPIEAHAYAIVEADITTAQFVFAHEAGHLFGGRHHNDPNGTYEHGYFFQTGSWPFRDDEYTLMYAQPGDYILHFSNPNVYYKGEATGTSSYYDVARKLRNTAATVEAFRAYTSPLSVYISGPARGDNSGTYTWTANPSNGVAPYSYLWSYSYDGSSYTSGFGTTQSITRSMPLDKDLYLKVVVTSSNNHTATGYHVTRNFTRPLVALEASLESPSNEISPGITLPVADKDLQQQTGITSTGLPISYPNPAGDFSTLSYRVEKDGPVKILLLDFSGKLLKTVTNSWQEKGFHNVKHSTADLREGIYYYQIITNSTIETNKLMITN